MRISLMSSIHGHYTLYCNWYASSLRQRIAIMTDGDVLIVYNYQLASETERNTSCNKKSLRLYYINKGNRW